MSDISGFGSRDEAKEFIERHRLFFDRFPNLKEALRVAFVREFATEANADKVVFYSGRLAVEDFNEMLVLSGNGYGAGALKLLRGMFERLVTAHYVHTHPTEADNFLDYFWVSQQKVLQVIKENFGADVLNKDLVEEVDTNYRRVKDKFMIPHCDECPKIRLNHNWTRMDIVSMAKVDGMFGKYLVDAYYVPLREAHSTAAAILSRLDIVEDTVTFEFRPQRKLADAALITSHRLLLLNLVLQQQHFKLEDLEQALARCGRDFEEIWPKG